MAPKKHLQYAEFYITNVCNLACTHCNRYNNYRFKGHQRWDDYAGLYQEWARNIDIDHIAVLGGEPLLNPDIIQWCKGLYAAFRPAGGPSIDIVSNGYHLNRVKGLYDLVNSGQAFLTISLHNPNEKDFIFQTIREFLKFDLDIQTKNPDGQWYIEHNKIKIFINANWDFTTSAVIRNSRNNRLTLHDSDPIKAHNVCSFAQCKCYHFIEGKFYKCGPVALMPEFDRQFDLDISEADRGLLNSYQPLTVDNYNSRSADFFSRLDDPIPQCKFCPSTLDWQPLSAMPKSSKLAAK